jgi:metabolite-proton symporter
MTTGGRPADVDAPLTVEEGAGRLSHPARLRAIIAGCAGNLIEWYDFFLYAFTSIYFAPLFFPNGDQTTQLLQTAGVFAVGFLARPVGGWFFGRYADRRGRRAAMVVSILLMGVGSLLIGILPTYAQIGVAAPFLLLIGRILQGFSTGGQYGTAATYLSEIAGSGKRGFYASFQYVTVIAGQLLAAGLLLLLDQFIDDAAMIAWGWRVLFLVGAVASLSIIAFRHQMHETATAENRAKDAGSVRAMLKHWRPCLVVAGLTAGGSTTFYTFTTYTQTYLVNTAGMSKAVATGVVTGALVPFMLMQPAFGLLSDRIGRRNSLIIFGALGAVSFFPLLYALGGVSNAGTAFALLLAALTICSFYSAISGLFKAELFPMHVRAVGVGLAYGVANAVFGGTAPYIALWFKGRGVESGFYWYVTAVCAISFITAVVMPDTRKNNPLDDVKL